MKLTCRSSSAEMQTPVGVHDAGGRMLMSMRKWLELTVAFLLKSWIICTQPSIHHLLEDQHHFQVSSIHISLLLISFKVSFKGHWLVLHVDGHKSVWNMQAYALHPPAAVLQRNLRPLFITQIRTCHVQRATMTILYGCLHNNQSHCSGPSLPCQ